MGFKKNLRKKISINFLIYLIIFSYNLLLEKFTLVCACGIKTSRHDKSLKIVNTRTYFGQVLIIDSHQKKNIKFFEALEIYFMHPIK